MHLPYRCGNSEEVLEYPFYSRSRLQSSLKARNAAILKSKGQNFLIDPNSVRKIADTVFALLDELSDSSAAQGKGDAKTDTDNSRDSQRPAGAGAATRPVAEGTTGESKPAPIELWEIGPGTGALSHVIWQGLQKRAALEPQREFRWLGIELDPVLCDILKTETFPAWNGSPSLLEDAVAPEVSDKPTALGQPLPNLTLSLLHTDARKFLDQRLAAPETQAPPTLRIICGNLPYYISTELLLASMAILPAGCAFLVQKEYAGRICDTKKGSSIAVFVRNWMEPLTGPRIGKNAFLPPPAVESSMLILRRKELQCDGVILEKVLRASFQGKRKTLRNSWKKANLGEGLSPELLEKAAMQCGLDPSSRAEDLAASDFYRIVNCLALIPDRV